jgi:Flp pilus assembly protein TadG
MKDHGSLTRADGLVVRSGACRDLRTAPRSATRRTSSANSAALNGERGAAVIEFLLVFLVLVVPLVYTIVVMADVQRALLAVSTAAREAGRVYVTAPPRDAEQRAASAYGEVLANFGYAAGDSRARMVVETICVDRTSECVGGPGPGAEITVRVVYRVPIARLPFIGAIAGPDLPVGATQHTRVDRYRGVGP